MKNIFFVLILTLLFSSCATTKKANNNALINELHGQNEMVIFRSLGAPSRVTQTADGGKIMVYEHYSKDEFLTPNKSSVTHNASQNEFNTPQGLTISSNANKVANASSYTIHEKNVSYLKVYINEQGNCFRVENTLPQEQLDVYHEQFKHFKTEN